MKKNICTNAIVQEALSLLNEVGIESVSTRKIAQRLGVEQPALYWHFKNKKELLKAMAYEAIEPHNKFPEPLPDQEIKDWFLMHMLSYRKSLLHYRDGARLHSIMIPDHNSKHLEKNVNFLIRKGFSFDKSRLIALIANKFAIGFIIEEQQEINQKIEDIDNYCYFIDKEKKYIEAISFIIDNLISDKLS